MRPAGTTSFLRGATSVSYMEPQKLGFSSKWTRKAIDESHRQLSVDAKLTCLSRAKVALFFGLSNGVLGKRKKTPEFTLLGCLGCLLNLAWEFVAVIGVKALGLSVWGLVWNLGWFWVRITVRKNQAHVSFWTSGLKIADSVEGNTTMLCNMVLGQSYDWKKTLQIQVFR